jgi:arylsulfatase A-like enzyme
MLLCGVVVVSVQPFNFGHGFAAGAATPQTPSSSSPTPTSGAATAGTATETATVAPTPPPPPLPTPITTLTSSPIPTTEPSATSTSNPTPIEEPTPPQHYVVFIVVDGAKPAYFNSPNLPNLNALATHGVVYDRAWVGQMESTTPGVHVTYGTGTLPRENGFAGFGWVTPDTHQRVDFRSLLANGQIDPVLKALPVPGVAERLHQFIPGAVSVAGSGHKDYATVGLGGGYADYEIYGKFGKYVYRPVFMHTPPPLSPAEFQKLTLKLPLAPGAEDAWAFDYASAVARQVHPRLLMLNLPEADIQGHWVGPDDRTLFASLMQNIDRGLGRLEATYRALGILDRTDFIITADHGMMESRPVPGWSRAAAAAVAAHTQILRAGDGPIWLADPSKAKAVATGILKLNLPQVEGVYYRSQLGPQYHFIRVSPASWTAGARVQGAFQRLLDTAAGVNGADVWVLFRENYTVIPRNVSGVWKGTHGGATWRVQHVPLIMSGPGIRAGIHSKFPARAIDIAPTIERLLGLPPIQRDGVILADAFSDQLPGEDARQQAATAQLIADVGAIQAQSNADVKAEPKFAWHPAGMPCRRSDPACWSPPHYLKLTGAGSASLDPQSLISAYDG